MAAEPSVGGTVLVDEDTLNSYSYSNAIRVGTRLYVEAVPALGYRFVEWSGHLSGNENPTSIKVIRNTTITAHFLPNVDNFTSEDGVLNVHIPEGTIARDIDDSPLAGLEIAVADILPALPLGANIIGPAYDVGPDGASFDQPIVLTWNYDPVDIPSGLAEEDLVIAYYHEVAAEWVELPSQIDPANDTVTAVVEHFTTFVMMCFTASPDTLTPAAFSTSSLSVSPQEVNVGEAVAISILVTNTGEEEGSCTITLKVDGRAVATKEQSLAGRDSETVAFTVSRDEVGTYSVNVNGLSGLFVVKEAALSPATPLECTALASTSPAKPDWWPIGGILAAIVAAIAVPLTLKRRHGRAKLSKGMRDRNH